jgi:hypothetical protein
MRMKDRSARRRSKAKGIVCALLLISACVVATDAALAQCACSQPDITAFEEFQKSEVVFIGEVLSSDVVEKRAHETRPDVYDMEIKFKVKKVWRKSLHEEVSVRFRVYGCIRSWDKGSEHLVYAFKDNKGPLRMGCCCTRTTSLQDATEDIAEFKKRGEEPKPIITKR